MKIKIIDLFVKLANKEEVPSKLVYKFKNGNFYEEYHLNWDNERNIYFYISNNDFKAHPIVDLLADNLWNLNDEAEIIEERPKEIELLEFDYDHTIFESEFQNSTDLEEKLIGRDDLLQEKINELIKEVNLLKKEDEGNDKDK